MVDYNGGEIVYSVNDVVGDGEGGEFCCSCVVGFGWF